MCFGGRALVLCVVLTMVNFGFAKDSAHSNHTELRPEYIHPEGADEFEPYLREYDSKDPEDDEEDYRTEEHISEASQPAFINEPKNGYITRNKPVTLKCSVANVLEVYFECNGIRHEGHQLEHVDPQHGVRVVEAEVNVTKENVAGVKGYSCECLAWNSKGSIRSRPVVVEIAYMKKQFAIYPVSSIVELGRSITLRCVPPLSNPPASVSWLKNGAPMETGKGNLVLSGVTMDDMANYSCVAENMAGRRETEPAVLTVYVNGGWSEWGRWMPCRCGDQTLGQQRSRSCNQPKPMNGGAACKGPGMQQTGECPECFEEGVWSLWGEWSRCDAECVRSRRRQCSGECSGSTEQHAVCADGACVTHRNITLIIVGVASVIVLLAAISVLLYMWCRKKNRRPGGYVMASTGLKESSSRPSTLAPDLTRSCNEYLVSGSEHSYDMPQVGSRHTSTFGSRSNPTHTPTVGRNNFEMQPYPRSGDTSSNGTYNRTFTSRSSGSNSPFVELPPPSKLDVAGSFPPPPHGGYNDKICFTIVK